MRRHTFPPGDFPNFARESALSDVLDLVQFAHANYFFEGADSTTALPYDRRPVKRGDPYDLVSIGAVGFGILAILVMAFRRWIVLAEACRRIEMILNSLEQIPRFKGAFPHFVQATTLKVVEWIPKDDGADLVETSLLIQGLICAREFFSGDSPQESRLRSRINCVCDAVEWSGFIRPSARPSLYWHWSPRYEWHLNTPITGWNEALIAYVLAAGSGSSPIDPEAYHVGWANEGRHRNGRSYHGHALPAGMPFGGPLFLSQYSFCGLDPRNLQDDYIDHWQQVVAHARINFEHCKRNPRGFGGYGLHGWGLTASDGPHGYLVSCPENDHGVLAPTAALSSFPFLPHEAEAALRSFLSYRGGKLWHEYGFVDAFSPGEKWISAWHLAINHGPVVAMIENFRSGLLWRLFMGAPDVQRGLRRLGFRRGPLILDSCSTGVE